MKDIKPSDMNTILANTEFVKSKYYISTKDIDLGPAYRYKNSDTLKLVPKFFKIINKQLHIYIPKGTRFLYRNTFSNYSAYLFSVDEINIEFVPGDNIDKNISKVLVLADELKTKPSNKIAQYLD